MVCFGSLTTQASLVAACELTVTAHVGAPNG